MESAIQTATSVNDIENTAATAVVGIPRAAVDDAIRSHHSAGGGGYSLYLLHPNVKGLYEYVHDSQLDAGGRDGSGKIRDHGRDAQKHGFTGECAFVGWVGKHGRYAWLDLGAYVSSGWGPSKRSHGIVTPFTFPTLLSAGKRSSAWLYAELAALTHRSASQLIVPPLLFTPAGVSGKYFQPLLTNPSPAHWSDFNAKLADSDGLQGEEVVVKIFFVCDASSCPFEKVQAWAELDELLREPGSAVEKKGGRSLMPRVTVERQQVTVWESPLLAAGLQQAMQPSRGGPLVSPTTISLNSVELRRWLRLFLDGKAGKSRGGEGSGERENTDDGREVRFIPLFIFNLDTDTPVLLDHSVRSAAFSDMIVSVNSRDSAVVDSNFHCGGRKVMLWEHVAGSDGIVPGRVDNAQDSTAEMGNGGKMDSGLLRDTLASLTRVIWGAPPRTLSWDPLTDTISTDYLWAAGASLDTPLSTYSSLSFTERDAYLRTHILRRIDAAVGATRNVLEQAASVEHRLVLVLYGGDYARAWQHWHGVQDNLVKCVDELAVHHFESAVRFVRALEAHVAGLGAVLSIGYGNGPYRTGCHCQSAVGKNTDFPESEGGSSAAVYVNRSSALLVDMASQALLVVAVFCATLAGWKSFRHKGSGRRARPWRKQKYG